MRGQDTWQKKVSPRTSSHPRGAGEVGVPDRVKSLNIARSLEIGINRGQLCFGQADQVP